VHCSTHGIELIDDRKVKLAQILNKINQKLLYVYDLGDYFKHKIRLEKIESTHTHSIELMDGERACPPEDCGSPTDYAKMLDVLDNPKHPEYKMTLMGASKAANYLHEKEPFDPNRFNLSQRKKFVQMTLHKETKNVGGNMTTFSFGDQSTTVPTFEESKYVAPKKECAVCGKTENLKRCSRCKIRYYCTSEHQLSDWKTHKKECQKLQ
jgi:hypothetical protein